MPIWGSARGNVSRVASAALMLVLVASTLVPTPQGRTVPTGLRSVGSVRAEAGTPPTTSIGLDGTLGNDTWFVSDVTTTLSSGSQSATTHYRVDSGAWQLYAGPFVITEGRHHIDYWSNDSSGDVEAMKTVDVKVDTTPPTFNEAAPSGVVTHSEVAVSWNVTDTLSGVVQVERSLDDGPFVPASGSRVDLALPDGSHYVTVKATDAAGNFAIYVISFQVDTSPWSPTGPDGWSPLTGFFELLLVIGIGAAVFVRRARHAARQAARRSRVGRELRHSDD